MTSILRARISRSAWRRVIGGVAALAAFSTLACDLDLENPNAPTEDEAVAGTDGVISLAVGMQGRFAETIDDYVVTNSLVTDEWGTRTLALVSYISLFTGQNFDPSFAVVLTPFSNSYQVVRSANTLLAAAERLELGTGMEAGITSLARLFKAMTLGMLIQQYEQVPIDIDVDAPVPEPRAVVLDTILTLLEEARSTLDAVTDPDLADFRTRVIGNTLNIRNTVDAMLARYYLMAGRYDDAITAAERVNLGVLSVLAYPPPTRNPVENLAFGLRYVGALKSFVDAAEAGDQRPAYWVNVTGAPLPANPSDSVLLPLSRYSLPNESFPLYLPDEMRLIRAEAHARLGEFPEAAALVNDVRTQTSSAVDEPVAGLPALPTTALDSEGELLAEIARQRRYELYEQGLRWEDTRRFGAALTTEPTLPFLPLPLQECTANPSNPCG